LRRVSRSSLSGIARSSSNSLTERPAGSVASRSYTDDYPGSHPYAFTGGTTKQAIVDVSGDHYVDLEMDALAMMKRE
jgi:hypothetical protein